MEQVFTPVINTPAQPAMCQKYINDAGKVANANPPRSGTAKAAFEKEQKAGRISKEQFPDNVWVVAWFAFTKGSYTYPDGSTIYYKDAWHVAFVKRSGTKLEIHDSEVHRGARKPYGSLQEVEAWFGAYGAKYAGWSTQCDGRIYAKKKGDDDMIKDTDRDYDLVAQIFDYASGRRARNNGKKLTRDEFKKSFVGKQWGEQLNKILSSSSEVAQWQEFAKAGMSGMSAQYEEIKGPVFRKK